MMREEYKYGSFAPDDFFIMTNASTIHCGKRQQLKDSRARKGLLDGLSGRNCRTRRHLYHDRLARPESARDRDVHFRGLDPDCTWTEGL